MSTIDPGSSSSSREPTLRNIKVGHQAEIGPDEKGQGLSPSHTNANGPQRESKLELFGFDSLVNILGLKSMTGEQVAAPSSPRDGEDISITHGHRK
ncbi:hypothetical protein CRG98_011714, partial [Punica granatum]